MSITLHLRLGDCVSRMSEMPEGSVGAVVSDPPYGLRFMGTEFDDLGDGAAQREWHVAWLTEAFRVLRPGGVIKAFGGTRTFHHLAATMRSVGFTGIGLESWTYGSGFPKSRDIGKGIDAMDKSGPMEERARTFTAWMRSTGITAKQIGEALSSRFDPATAASIANHYTTHPTQPRVATEDLFDLLRPLLPTVPDEIEELVRSRTVESENMKRRAVVGRSENGIAGGTGEHAGSSGAYGFAATFDITEPYTDAARAWEGWGTALKPSWEPVVVGRKPSP